MVSALIVAGLVVFFLMALPIVIALAAVFLSLKLVLGLILLPFRMAGWMIKGTLTVAAMLVTGALAAVLLGGLALVLIGVAILPLMPILLLAGVVYVLYWLLRPNPVPTV